MFLTITTCLFTCKKYSSDREVETVIDTVICQAFNRDLLHLKYYTLYSFASCTPGDMEDRCGGRVCVGLLVRCNLPSCFLIIVLTWK